MLMEFEIRKKHISFENFERQVDSYFTRKNFKIGSIIVSLQ